MKGFEADCAYEIYWSHGNGAMRGLVSWVECCVHVSQIAGLRSEGFDAFLSVPKTVSLWTTYSGARLMSSQESRTHQEPRHS